MVDSTLSRATATSCASLPVTLATITTFPPNPDRSLCAHNRWRCWACSGAGGRRLARSADDDRSGHIKHRYPSYPLTTLTVRPLLHPFPSLPLLRPCFVSREAAMHAADHCSSITLLHVTPLRPCFVSREAAMHAADHCSSITLLHVTHLRSCFVSREAAMHAADHCSSITLLHVTPLRPCFVSREAAMHAADHCSSITLYLSLISSFCSIFGVDVCLVCSSQQPREGEGKGGRGCK